MIKKQEATTKIKDGADKKIMVGLDVRDGDKTRARVEAILKEQRRNVGSKFMRPSFSLYGYSYNQSRKL